MTKKLTNNVGARVADNQSILTAGLVAPNCFRTFG